MKFNRNIDIYIAQKYCKQIIFSNEDNDRKQLALAWINIENYYDIRTPYDEKEKNFMVALVLMVWLVGL